jgi:hypothetical protein
MTRLRLLALTVATLSLTAACGSTVQVTGTRTVDGGTGDSLGGSTGDSSDLTGGTSTGSTTGLAGGSSSGATTGLGSGTSGTSSSGSTGGSGTSGTSGTSGSGTSGASSTATSGTSGGPAAIPATGFGYDKKSVYIGVTTQKDVNTAAQSVGADGLNAGDQEAQTKATLAYLNSHGGLFGRQVKPIFHDESTVDTAANPVAAGNAACTYFTQDHPVIAVLNPVTLMDTDNFRACLAKKKVPLFSASVAASDQRAANSLAPYFYQSVAPTWDVLAPVLTSALTKAGYFGGWNPQTGKPRSGKATIGIYTPDTVVGRRVGVIVDNALKAAGHSGNVIVNFGTGSGAAQSGVLTFNQRGVDHVIATDSNLIAFQTAAANQGYMPRYGITSLNAPLTFLQTNGTAAQNKGDLGVGWAPAFDVDEAHDPGSVGPGEDLCKQIMTAGGQSFSGKRLAEAVAFAFCDGLRLIVAAGQAGNGMTGVALYQGVQKIGPTFPTAFSFAPGLGQDRLFVPGAVRPLAYVTSCSCFQYTSRANTRL